MDGEGRIDKYHWNCPLLGKVVEDGLCCDISHAQRNWLKKEAVPEVKDWDKAEKICPNCEFY